MRLYRFIKNIANQTISEWFRLFLLAGTSLILLALIFTPFVGLLPESTISAVVPPILAIFTFWYSYNTYRRLLVAEDERELSRGQIAPQIDFVIEVIDNRIFAEITNRGHGVAKNVELIVSVDVRGGDRYQYRGEFERSLRPGEWYTDDTSAVSKMPLELEPKFWNVISNDEIDGGRHLYLSKFIKHLEWPYVFSIDVEYEDVVGNEYTLMVTVRSISNFDGLESIFEEPEVRRDPYRVIPFTKRLKFAWMGHELGRIEEAESRKTLEETISAKTQNRGAE